MEEFTFEEKPSKPRKAPKGFAAGDTVEAAQIAPEPALSVEVEETAVAEVEPAQAGEPELEPEQPAQAPAQSIKRHDHSIRPMTRLKPVPKRGEKAASRVRR